jgi:hypothetical protein
MTTVKPIKIMIPPAPPSILNWDATRESDLKTLARYACEASTLTNLVAAGLETEAQERGDLFRQITAFTECLCFKLAQQLGALEDV